MSSTSIATSPGLLRIDLDAVARNYRRLAELAAPATCAAVVKADAYGLGVDAIATTLAGCGCRQFFVANLPEAQNLRALLPDAEIFVLSGVEPGDEAAFAPARLVPVLNSLAQIRSWVRAGNDARSSAAIQIDTGMTRLGLDSDDLEALAADSALLGQLDIAYVLTHLACADEPDHPLNEAQLARFDRLREMLPAARSCIGNSAGIFGGASSRGDMVRAGIALYGGNPFTDRPNPMETVVRLHSPILQVRELKAPTTVGYGATCELEPPARIATVGAGYADGYPRSLGNVGRAYIGGVHVPVVGRVSMDMLTVDVSDVPASELHPGALVELLGDHIAIDELAAAAGTISYEILTRLGRRWTRRYERGQ
jgi:alanine racemase